MATNFSPCKGSYVLNQFPSNVMFGMNGFHVSASGAIQGHHGPLVSSLLAVRTTWLSRDNVTLTYVCACMISYVSFGAHFGKKTSVYVWMDFYLNLF